MVISWLVAGELWFIDGSLTLIDGWFMVNDNSGQSIMPKTHLGNPDLAWNQRIRGEKLVLYSGGAGDG